MKAEPDKAATFHRWSLALYKEIADTGEARINCCIINN